MRKRRMMSLLCTVALLAGMLPIGMLPAKAADPWVNNADVSWIDPSKKLVAFTFDDGPVGIESQTSAKRIQDVMEQYGMHCTYFYVGKEITDARLHEIERAYSLGCEIGNHTFNHDYLTNLNANQIQEQIAKVNDILYPISGNSETVVRPPYGSTNPTVTSSANCPLINWSLDSADWNNGNYNSVLNNVRRSIQDGSIILFHETYDFTAQAVETLVPELIEQGYVIVSVSELMKMKGITMTRGTVYTNQAVGKKNVYVPTPAEQVQAKIKAIGEVTLDSAAAISEARTAFDALTDEQKAQVNNYETLTAAEAALAAMQKEADDLAAAANVEETIAAIGEVTLESEAAIAEARAAYDALTEEQQALVENAADLERAEEALAAAKEQAAIDAVREKIAAIGEVTLDSADAISGARAAYEALTDEQKALVENYDTLTAAEAALEELQKAAAFRFDDVNDEGKFYYDPVYWAFNAEPQITNGLTATAFGPDAGCTRGQVVTFLWRAAGCPEPKSADTPFTDLKDGGFYVRAVAWAVENGITNGMTKTAFGPDATCTRGQIVTFLWRFWRTPAPDGNASQFTDVAADAFYAKAVAWAVGSGITNGMSAGKFAPDATCTRGQVVTFLYRAMVRK